METMTVSQESLHALRTTSRTFYWLIKRFSSKSNHIRSRSFTFPRDANIGWQLTMVPIRQENGDVYSEVILSLISPVNQELPLFFSLALADKALNVLRATSFLTYNFSREHSWWTLNKMIGRQDLLGRIAEHDDQLIVICKMNPIGSAQHNSALDKKHKECRRAFLDAFNCFSGSTQYADVILVSSTGQEFPAHKIVLAARSPVFAAMFQSNMVENQSNRVQIEDIDHRTLSRLLAFIYCPRISPGMSNEDLIGLFQAAHKYGIGSLQDLLEVQLMISIDVTSACDLLIFADLMKCEQLKHSAMDFICSPEAESLFESQKWKDFVTRRPDLLEECFRNKLYITNFDYVTE